jgi:hypothetical protein
VPIAAYDTHQVTRCGIQTLRIHSERGTDPAPTTPEDPPTDIRGLAASPCQIPADWGPGLDRHGLPATPPPPGAARGGQSVRRLGPVSPAPRLRPAGLEPGRGKLPGGGAWIDQKVGWQRANPPMDPPDAMVQAQGTIIKAHSEGVKLTHLTHPFIPRTPPSVRPCLPNPPSACSPSWSSSSPTTAPWGHKTAAGPSSTGNGHPRVRLTAGGPH